MEASHEPPDSSSLRGHDGSLREEAGNRRILRLHPEFLTLSFSAQNADFLCNGFNDRCDLLRNIVALLPA